MDVCGSTHIHTHPQTSTHIHRHPLWIFVDICGSTFIHKYPHLSTWTFVDPHSSTWTFADPQTSTWIHMWIFVDLCGFLWIFVVHKYPQKNPHSSTIIHTRLAEVELRTRTTMSKKTTETETEAKSGWVNWRNCPAREVLLQDLEPGGLLHDMDHVGADVLFHFYKLMPQFNDVGFDQFKARLADHRKQSWKKHELASRDEDACAHDRRLFPPEYRDSRGKLKFDLHPAKALLRKDVTEKVHLGMKPSELRKTRMEYQEFDAKTFKDQIYQEVRRQKYLNHLAIERENKKAAKKQSNNTPMLGKAHFHQYLRMLGIDDKAPPKMDVDEPPQSKNGKRRDPHKTRKKRVPNPDDDKKKKKKK